MFRTNSHRAWSSRPTAAPIRMLLLATLVGATACHAPSPVSIDFATCETAMGPDCVVGTLSVVVSGLPTSVNADVTITGPNEFSEQLSTSTTLEDLLPGEYTIQAAGVAGSDTTYDPEAPSQTVTVTAADSVAAEVGYVANEAGSEEPPAG